MRPALATVESSGHALGPAADHPLHRLLDAVHPGPGRVTEGGFRFWACASGADGRSQTSAVWGLWLDQAIVFAADTESIAGGDPTEFAASMVQLDEDGKVRVVDGDVERVDDPALLVRFASECEAKYGFEPDPEDPDTPVYAMRQRLDSERPGPT